MTATLIPYSKMSWKSVLSAMPWLHGFEKITHHLRVACASDDTGPIVHVYFTRVEDAFLIVGTITNQKAFKEAVGAGGDEIDLLLEKLANSEGVSQLFMISDNGVDCTLLRTYTRRVLKSELTELHVAYLN